MRNAMMDRHHALAISRLEQLGVISWGSVYTASKSVGTTDPVLMRRLEELRLEHPLMDPSMLRDQRNREGADVGRKHLDTLMKSLDMEALCRKPGTGKTHLGLTYIPTYCVGSPSIERTKRSRS